MSHDVAYDIGFADASGREQFNGERYHTVLAQAFAQWQLRSRQDRSFGVLRLLSAAGMTAVVIALWPRVDTINAVPPFALPVLATLALVVNGARLPIAIWLFWLTGLLSLAWSLGPGNTVVTVIWESLLVAGFAVGVVPVAAGVALSYFVIDGYQDAVALASFGLQSYLSGSIGYVAGAMGAAASALGAAFAVAPRMPWLSRLLAVLVASIGATTALASGSRAVFLALALGLLMLITKHWSVRVQVLRLVAVVAIIALSVLGLEKLNGNSLVSPASETKGTVAQATAVVESHGVLRQRLRLWHQGLNAAIEYPLGTGAGTYATTVHSFQSYPMLWSSSPHNYVVQVLATGGWLRFGLLMLFLFTCLRWGLRGGGWPWTLGALVLGTTTLFDVTGGYPKVMVMTFMLLGAGYFQGRKAGTEGTGEPVVYRPSVVRWPQYVGLVALTVTVGWWYWPCDGAMCSVNRYLGLDRKVLPALEAANASEQTEILDRIQRLYPRSLWVDQVLLAYAGNPQERLERLRDIAETYPYQHPDNYLNWSKAALDLGDPVQATHALQVGLSFFPRDTYPYGEMRMTPERYAAWADEAESMLAVLTDD